MSNLLPKQESHLTPIEIPLLLLLPSPSLVAIYLLLATQTLLRAYNSHNAVTVRLVQWRQVVGRK